LYEVRSLGELAERVARKPRSFGFIEVNRANFSSALRWLSDARQRFAEARFAALLEIELVEPALANRRHDRQDVANALLEAGAVTVTDSPRRLHQILLLAERHGVLAALAVTPSRSGQTLVEWAQTLLPWQER
jgi:hypothetical protein